jgi:hypothetical protein
MTDTDRTAQIRARLEAAATGALFFAKLLQHAPDDLRYLLDEVAYWTEATHQGDARMVGAAPRYQALRDENTRLAAQLDRGLKLAGQLCECDDPDRGIATDPDTGAVLRHHCECPALYMETALDPTLGHQHEPCLSQTARALDEDRDTND